MLYLQPCFKICKINITLKMVSMVKTIDNKLNEIKNKLHGTRVFEPTT